jgi:hypothetical protein
VATSSTTTTTTTTTSTGETVIGSTSGGTVGGVDVDGVLSLLNLKQMRAPEQFPKGIGGDPTMDDLRKRINDNNKLIQTTINNLINNITNNTVSIGVGTAAAEWVIGASTPDITNPYTTTEYLTSGNRAIQVLPDGQLMVMWMEDNGATTDKTACFLKSRSPFDRWTNLAETDDLPTRQVTVASWGGGGAFQPAFCVNPTTGNLHVIGHSAAGKRDYVFTNDGTGKWTYSANYAAETAGRAHKCAHLVATDDHLIYLSYGNSAATIGSTTRASQSAETTWSDGVYFDRYWDTGTVAFVGFASQGEQQRAIPLGDGRLLVLMDFVALGVQSNIAWAMSYDDGLTFPETAIPSPGTNLYRGIGYPGDATGFLFPVTGTAWNTANLVGGGTSTSAATTWEAFRIGETQRVGLIYSAAFHGTSGSQDSGTMYAEFDADTLAWTTQADHFRLTRQNVINNPATNPSLPLSTDGSGQYRHISGKTICTADDKVRCFWYHAYDASGVASDVMVGIGTRTLDADGTHTDFADWNSMRIAKPFGGVLAGSAYRNTEFCGANATVEIAGVTFYPVLWTRQRGSVTAGSTHELCVQLLPLSVLDAP